MLLAQYVSHIPIHLFNFALHTNKHTYCNYASAGVRNNPNPFEQPLTANLMMLFVVLQFQIERARFCFELNSELFRLLIY